MQATASAPNWKDWADAAASAAQALAIIVAGIWAYFKFLRGRTFAHRVELTVTPTVLPKPRPWLKIRATLRNAGLSKLPLRTQAVFVFGVYAAPTESNPLAVKEQRLGKAKAIFAAHKWIEPGETVTDEILVLVPDPRFVSDSEWLALRVECRVFARRRKEGSITWTASAIVPTEGEEGDQVRSSTTGLQA